ncbi:hypothetical protein CLAIMM_00137 [Cladophialophora immunda]|nr:hypothetical protein CLAIMM_00137 [Cladophialophora immunda]
MQAFLANSFLLAAVTLSRCVTAQVVGCEAVDCPADGCVVGNTTNLELGIANFTSGSLSPDQPLSWTVGIADIPHHNAVNDTWLRSYYLGTPPSLDLDQSGISGCALFFEDSGTFQFNISAPETSIGTCQDALTTKCVDDLVARVANITATLSSDAATNANQSTLCSQLGPALKADLPASCMGPVGLELVPIVAKDLTGSSSALQPVQQTNCTLTTGGSGYNVGLVTTESYHQQDFAEVYTSGFIFGVTPILTLFYPTPSQPGNSSTALQEPEVHLTCVKIVEAGASDAHGPTLLNAAASRSIRDLYSFLPVTAFLALIFVAL